MAPWHQTEISANIAGLPEASGIINRGCEGERGELADAGNAHQPTASIECPDSLTIGSYVRIDRYDGGEHGDPHRTNPEARIPSRYGSQPARPRPLRGKAPRGLYCCS